MGGGWAAMSCHFAHCLGSPVSRLCPSSGAIAVPDLCARDLLQGVGEVWGEGVFCMLSGQRIWFTLIVVLCMSGKLGIPDDCGQKK